MSFSAFRDVTGLTIVAHCDWQRTERSAELSDALVRGFVHKDPTARLPVKVGPEQAFIDVVAFGFFEVTHAYDTLEESRQYLTRPVPADIERAHYLRYHLEHWLHTTYVLKERTRTYIKAVAKLYRRTASYSDLVRCAGESDILFTTTFGRILGARGVHVHIAAVTPPGLQELYVFDSMAQVYGKSYTHPAVPKYAEIVAEWSDLLRDANAEITSVLGQIFDAIHPHLFNGEQPILPPGDLAS